MSIMSKLTDLENLNSLALAQKAKIKWSIEGDENSKYFHGIINKQRNNLAIRGILVDGAWIEDPKIVKDDKLSIDQKTDLERPFMKEEIKGAVWDCGLNKSPGPDGCNSSFIALIPKTHDAKQVKEFKTISLIGSLYKIIVKLLANRLVILMGDLVNEVQSAIIDNRQIFDGPFILNEVLQWCKAKKKQTMLFKVDFEKAFDSVRWDFLDDVLKKFGFGDRWCDWIQSCLRSSRGSILVNGSPTSKFQFHKGLKQSDPLSLFLFILIMESLHLSFQNVVNAGMFKGVTLDNSLQLSYLFYADDVVFLGQCKIMGIAVENLKVDITVADIGCMMLKSPFTYLGVKVGGRMRCTNSWEEIIHKILSRLSKWKIKTLSIGGRLTLLKLVLGSMPIYYMSKKINIHAWRVKMDNLPTRFNLSRRDDIIESVISCETAKSTWTDLVPSFEGPSDTKENRIMDLKLEYQTFRAKPSESLSQSYTRYKTLLNELTNDGSFKQQDAEMKVLKRECLEKLTKAKELKKKRIDQYRWTTSNRLKPETITDIYIHPNTKPVVITVYRDNAQRNFDVHNPFKFGDYGVTKLDELGSIIQKKKNKVVGELMTSLEKRSDRLKHQELEPEVRIPGLECNRILPEGISFVNNLVSLKMDSSLLMSLAMRP
ncbi:RNA-directed DNA polymerase, eukaryota [Tanacetum coccineum]